MTQSASSAVDKIKAAIYEATKGLGRPEYISTLENIHGDVDSMIEAARIDQEHEEKTL